MDIVDQKLKELVHEKRYEHTKNVVAMAIKLAKNYGFPHQKAEIAALLHDICKNFTIKRMKELVGKNNNDTKNYEVGEILHGYAAAVYARNRFSIEDKDILNAIRYHTVGRAGMSELEKIIYLADAIEVERNYEGIEDIRKLAFIDLNEAILLEINLKLKYLINTDKILHPNTIAMRNWLLNKRK